MRDIRSDLHERLKVIQCERLAAEQRLETLAQQEKLLRDLLQNEEARWSPRQRSIFASGAGQQPAPNGGTALGQFIRETMADGQIWSLERLKEAAQAKGVFFGGKKPGRVLHYALVGMTNKNYVEQTNSGMWRLIKQESDTTSA